MACVDFSAFAHMFHLFRHIEMELMCISTRFETTSLRSVRGIIAGLSAYVATLTFSTSGILLFLINFQVSSNIRTLFRILSCDSKVVWQKCSSVNDAGKAFHDRTSFKTRPQFGFWSWNFYGNTYFREMSGELLLAFRPTASCIGR